MADNDAKTLTVKPASKATAFYEIPATKRFVFNETGNILIASTAENDASISPQVREVFQEVAVFFAAMTKALSTTVNPSTANPTKHIKARNYNLYDAEGLENIIEGSGMFVHVYEQDLNVQASGQGVTFNTELISAVLGMAATDGLAGMELAGQIVSAIGKQATIGVNNETSTNKIAHILFVCEYLMGMPIVSAQYFTIDKSVASTYWEAGPCISGESIKKKLIVHKDVYLFVIPKFIRKYADDLLSVFDDLEYAQLVARLRALLSGMRINSVTTKDGESIPQDKLAKDESYVINGRGFGTKGTLSFGGATIAPVTDQDWTDTKITFKVTGDTAVAEAAPIRVENTAANASLNTEASFTYSP